MSLQTLETYDISASRGFLCRFDAEAGPLGEGFAEARSVALKLPQILPSGQVRHYLRQNLPDMVLEETVAAMSDAQVRMAMVHFSFLVQAYVWGEPDVQEILPRFLARPIVVLANRLGQQPLLPYSAYVLDNWARLNPTEPVDLENIYMIQNFLSGQDEAWFVLIHVAIEARAGSVLALMAPILEAVVNNDPEAVQNHLETMAEIWGAINAIFNRMPERCDPYIYFERVRPFIHGWKDNPALPHGLIYEGIEKYNGKPQAFRGQTGSQSSIVPAMDALLGIGHAADPLKTYLDQLHIYRPPSHRRFIDDVRAKSQLRQFVKRVSRKNLVGAYNATVQAVADFRTRHLEYAAAYIHKQRKHTGGNDTDVGTGGTPFMKYLKKHRDETAANLVHL